MEWFVLALWTSSQKPETVRRLGLNLLAAIGVVLATSAGLLVVTKYVYVPVLSPWICAGISLLLACLALILLNIAVGRNLRDKG